MAPAGCGQEWDAPLASGVDLIAMSGYPRAMGHETADEASLEMGRRVAARLRQQPELLHAAWENLDRWTQLNGDSRSLLRCYAEWRGILNRPLEEICGLLADDSEEGRRLRQNSPFAGVLSAKEVWEIKHQFRHAKAAA